MGKNEHTRVQGHSPLRKFEIILLGHLKQLEMCLKPRFFLILSLSMGIHPYSGIKSGIAHGARS